MNLLDYKDNEYQDKAIYYEFFSPWRDVDYVDFLSKGGTSFYFSKALHVYGLNEDDFHNVFKINELFAKEYSFALKHKTYCFACDVFGNQFCFSDKKVTFFSLETCEEEILGTGFKDWMNQILDETDYYTGFSIVEQWEELMLPLKFSDRFVPKKPFVVGGEYTAENVRAANFIEVLKYNSDIARQIYDLPNGTEIRLIFK